MVVRPLDSNGDYVPVSSLDQMITGKKAVAQIVDLRLNFYYGEWWENREIGFKVPEFLMKTIRSGEVSLLANYIAAYVMETQGIRGVLDVTIETINRQAKFHCIALTTEGRNVDVEVNLDGIL